MLVPPATDSRPSVLIVDRSKDSREVLRTVLEKRGVRTWEAAEARRGVELARQHHPQVIVLDLEAGDADHEEIRESIRGGIQGPRRVSGGHRPLRFLRADLAQRPNPLETLPLRPANAYNRKAAGVGHGVVRTASTAGTCVGSEHCARAYACGK